MKTIVVSALIAVTGCAQVLGLDDTKLDKIDAAIDAPGICDGAPNCSSLNGRTICGQLFHTGDLAGLAVRVAAPTGIRCAAGNTEGPCGLAVRGISKAAFLGNTTTGSVDAVIDDCGRYAVIDFDSTQADVAIVVTSTDVAFKRTATLLLGRATIAGPGNVDQNIDALVVTKATAMSWATQVMPAGTPPDTATGYLVKYTRMSLPLANVQVAKDGSSGFTSMPGSVPWAAYFGGTTGFGALDPMAIASQKTGHAFTVLGGGAFSLQGVSSGRRCRIDGLNQVDNALIYVTVPNC